jgi:hypothetical protein
MPTRGLGNYYTASPLLWRHGLAKESELGKDRKLDAVDHDVPPSDAN